MAILAWRVKVKIREEVGGLFSYLFIYVFFNMRGSFNRKESVAKQRGNSIQEWSLILCGINSRVKDNWLNTRQFQFINDVCAPSKTHCHGKISKYVNKLIRSAAVIE